MFHSANTTGSGAAQWWLAFVISKNDIFISLLCSRISFFSCCTLSRVVGDGLSVSAQLRISSSLLPANNCEYGISDVVTFVGERGLSLVRPSFSSIGEAMTLGSDEEGDNEGWLNLSTCPCTSYTYGSEADLKGPINQFLVESRALFTIRRSRTPGAGAPL